MKFVKQLMVLCFSGIFACTSVTQKESDKDNNLRNVSDELLDYYGITNRDSLSAASKLALSWPKHSNDWFIEFEVYDLKGDFAYEEGVVRRDPSSIIKHDGKYFCCYTRSTGTVNGFDGDIENEKVFPW